ncbi:hypothetical protein KDA14_04920, partial [Candidatus Saccharibacteria bacterium]|nr:hypothetical protein [Candidatus Saccharibacteria bacterium]
MRISKALAAPSIVTDIVCRGETGVGLIDAYESLFPEEPLKIGGRKVGGMTTTQRFTVEKNGQKRLYAGRSIVTLAKFNHPGGYAPN